ncbi:MULTISPECIES: DNA adenine methylase [Clostridia]|uniref:Modification methylase n=1 Tax=Lacrimispora saccharolytica (strain ATCC 35040 / DSM 2544 / NRCC 2533 / WM1) TaxID=610130 RepID=D9R2V1_LACSW|nr:MULTISPECIES: DNA adenine methylase [Clostridia]ADL02941.1 modification methylase [[Clostridium] saccharolyticum WM1]QRV18864.1 DNA adenine methylase [Lacrimispora saccharolytica]
MNLANVLNSYSDEYWDFKDAKNDGIHSIANYPAPMVAPMQHELLNLLLRENQGYQKMLDPFHGSGVTLVEGQSLGLEVWGMDINPYAHIISLAKLEKYDPKIIEPANHQIIQRIENLKKSNLAIHHSFDNIQKWFRDDVIDDLRIIRTAITMESNLKTRRYYWLCFGEIVKRYSNTRTSTFKLHVKESEKISEMQNNVLEDFFNKIKETYKLIGYPKLGPFHLTCGDSIEIMKTYKPNSFDIICTSPPYGDNATTVTYGQFSILQLLWIDNNDFQYDSNCVDNFSKIDSMSLGGAHSANNAFYYSPIISSYISQLSLHKQTKIKRFYTDYENAFRLMTRLLKPKGSMLLTLGNRMVDRLEFPFIDVNKEIAQYYGLELIHVINRNIMKKRMPIRVSRLSDGKPVDSMSKETVLLFRKGEH